MVILVGIIYFFVYFLLFRFMILRKNYATPGRESDDEETKLYTRADYNEKKNGDDVSENNDLGAYETSKTILDGLGGKDNIINLDCCATRLRVTVRMPERVSEIVLKQSGAAGVIKNGNGVQVVYGPQVAVIKSELEDYLKTL